MFGFFKRVFGGGGARGDVARPEAAGAGGDGGGPVIAMVALPRDVPLDATAVVRALRQDYGVEAGEVTGGHGPGATAVTIDVGDGAFLALATMPAPIPWSDLEGPCATAWHWPEATDVMRAHRAHVIVALMGGAAGGPVGRGLLVTRAAAAVATTHGATGVYWGGGTVVNPADRFAEMARDASPADPPVMLWVEVRYAPNADGSALAFTTGMGPLGHMEFEVRDTRRPPGDVIEMLLDLCLYVLRQGPVLLHGQTFGRTHDELLKVRHGPSKVGGRGKVIILGM